MDSRDPQASCTPTLSGLKSYEEALSLLLSQATPVVDTETVALGAALGRVAAAPLGSPVDVPGWDYSAMDGYAVRAADVPEPGASLPVSQRIPAGTAPVPLQPGSAARIFTGAPIPEGCDTVVIQEVCAAEAGRVTINAPVTADQNIRRRGEDIARGAVIIEAGTRLAPQHLGLAASVGVPALEVYRRLKVAVFTSGDELVAPGEPLAPGKIYNSNRYTAIALLQALGCEVVDLGIVADDLEATVDAMRRAGEQADLILASGGVSVGEEDHVKPAVERLGSLDLWKIAIRPGKPVAFGRIGDAHFFGSPGNPVSLFVTFLLFARPFILKRQGVSDLSPLRVQALADFDWPKPDKRREFHRARLWYDAAGVARLSVHPSRSSGVLSSVTWANGLVIIPEGRIISKGDPVDFLPFAELLQ
jgi:molybdopterin molybdotransferase